MENESMKVKGQVNEFVNAAPKTSGIKKENRVTGKVESATTALKNFRSATSNKGNK